MLNLRLAAATPDCVSVVGVTVIRIVVTLVVTVPLLTTVEKHVPVVLDDERPVGLVGDGASTTITVVPGGFQQPYGGIGPYVGGMFM